MNLPALRPTLPPACNQFRYAYAIACVISGGQHQANWLGMHRCLRNRLNKLEDLRMQCEKQELDAIICSIDGEIEGLIRIAMAGITLQATANSSYDNSYAATRRWVADELRELEWMSGDSTHFIEMALQQLNSPITLPGPPQVLKLPYFGGII